MEPPDPPSDVDVILSDGTTARIRLIRPEDAAEVRALHDRISRETMVLRFFGPHRLSDRELDDLVHADGVDRVVLVAERQGRVVGVTEYDRTSGQNEAEVAFLVDDTLQGLGIGTIMLEHLAAEARRHGIRQFAADTLAQNHRMLGVLRSAGFARRYQRSSEVVRVVLDITPSPAALAAADERDRNAVVRSMERLLRPRSIAVIGASREPGTVGNELLRNLVGGGFCGPIYPVNPAATSVAGLPCWPDVDSVPAAVDLAVVAVPAADTPAAVEACGRKGIHGLVIVSAGFADIGPDGAVAERALTRLAHQLGMRLVGPNCFGVANADPAVSMNATFARVLPGPGRVGFASQSGGLGIAILADASRRGIGMSSFVSMGNKADVSGNDLITWWGQDPDTDVVLLYLESFGNPRKFHRVARQVSDVKPIVAVKGARTVAGSRGVPDASHRDVVVDALLRQTGVLRVDTIEELFDVTEVLVNQPLPAGGRVGIVANAGGPGVLAADACAGQRLEVPELSAATQATLHALAPAGAQVANPVDLVQSASADTYRATLEILLGSDEVDAVMVIFTPPLVTTAGDVADAVAAVVDASEGDTPVVASFLGTADVRRKLAAAKRPVPCFDYPEPAAKALARAAQYAEWRRHPRGHVPHLEGVDPNTARRLTADAAPAGGRLPATVALEVLAAYGIDTTPEPPLPRPGATVELVAGFSQDPAFGPLVELGIGGPLAQAGPRRLAIAPLTDVEARELVSEMPGASLLGGDGTAGAPNIDAVVDLVLRLGRLAEDLPELIRAECRPVIVGTSGVSVADAQLDVATEPPPPPDLTRHLT